MLLAIALGANIPSKAGQPISTLRDVRPKIELIVNDWVNSLLEFKQPSEVICQKLIWRWSPLFETEPMGGPSHQPNYVNAALIVDGKKLRAVEANEAAAVKLLKIFLDLEMEYGRDRKKNLIRWGPRTLDIDLIAWGDLQIKNDLLTLPHPRLIERSFVLIPIAEALNSYQNPPKKISGGNQWNES